VDSLAIAATLVHDLSEKKKKSLGFRGEEEVESATTGTEREFTVFGFQVILNQTEEDLRALAFKSIKYIQNSFEPEFVKFYSAMTNRAQELGIESLNTSMGFEEYERFRPRIRHGIEGWGEKNRFHLNDIRIQKGGTTSS
jgi:hypothetical protein